MDENNNPEKKSFYKKYLAPEGTFEKIFASILILGLAIIGITLLIWYAKFIHK